MIALASCGSSRELKTVENLDINKYSGLWYEIARLPNRFEKGLVCTTADYSIKQNGRIKVINKGYFEDNKEKYKDISGTAWIPDKNFPGRLKVRFFWPFAGNYYIIALDSNYNYALVGDPSRKYLWILAREKELSQNIYRQLLDRAKSEGFNTEAVIKIDQDCGS